MPSKWIVLTMVVVMVGCQSAEERCNAAKVEAYDAWSAYAVAARAEYAARAEQCRVQWADAVARAAQARGAVTPSGACGDIPEEGESMDAYMRRCPDGTDTVGDCDLPREGEAMDAFEARCRAASGAPAHRAVDAPTRAELDMDQSSCELRAVGAIGVTDAQAEHVRDLARGAAIPFRDAVAALRTHVHEIPDAPELAAAQQRALAAADDHWAQCSTVSP